MAFPAGVVVMMVRTHQQRTVILDLGNVVLDWDVSRILYSLKLEKEEVRLLRNELFNHQDWLDMDHGKVTESVVVSAVCSRSTLSGATVEKALLAAKNSLAPIDQSLVLMQEISDQGMQMFCLSNMSRETYAHIKDHELFKLFSGIVISGLEGCMKPDEDIFHLTLERFGLEPLSTLFIDDNLPNIKTAEKLGINGFHFKRSRNCYAGIRKILFE